MSWLAKAALYALREVASPTLTKIGESVGETLGERVSDGLKPKEPEKSTPPLSLPEAISEDERTP